MGEPEVSIVMPCLNEEETVGACVDDARSWLEKSGTSGEILVIDNGCTDRSARVAEEHGARVIPESRGGYGYALRRGFAESRGRVILMGDCDTTYDFRNLDPLYRPLAENRYDMMIGDRMGGGLEKGAMSLAHRVGVRFLSALGRLRYHTKVRDFHCGLRGLTVEAVRRMEFRCGGMEFATEMIALAARSGMRIGQCPVILRRCRGKRKSKLRTLPDGFRHVRYILFGEKSGKKG